MIRGARLAAALFLTAFPAGAASLSVELIRGLPAQAEPASAAPRVELLVDLTASMNAPMRRSLPRSEAARAAAARLLESLPGNADVTLHVLRPGRRQTCEPEIASAHSSPGKPRGSLLRELEGPSAAGEASLADAVGALRDRLSQRDALLRTRLVVFSDLGSECGGNLCDELSDVVAGGATVDLVVLGDAPTPECVERFVAIGSWRQRAATGRKAPGFEAARDGRLLAAGLADGSPVVLSPGRATVVIGLEPPLRVGPLSLAADERGRLRVLEFPALDPPVREWFWSVEAEGGPGSTAAPPAATTLRHGP